MDFVRTLRIRRPEDFMLDHRGPKRGYGRKASGSQTDAPQAPRTAVVIESQSQIAALELPRECPAIDAERRLGSDDVLERPMAFFMERGTPTDIRSDNGSEVTAIVVPVGLGRLGVETRFIEVPGRTDPTSRSTASCATRLWTGRSSAR
jgi:hypothetical protein